MAYISLRNYTDSQDAQAGIANDSQNESWQSLR